MLAETTRARYALDIGAAHVWFVGGILVARTAEGAVRVKGEDRGTRSIAGCEAKS